MIDQLQETILGTMIKFPVEIDTAAAIVKASDFSNEMYQDIFQYLVDKQGADYILLAKEFHERYPINEILAWEDLSYMPSFLSKHCYELKEINRKDMLFRILADVRMGIESQTSDEILETINHKLLSVESAKSKDMEGMKTLIAKTIKTLELRFENKGQVTGIPYGWAKLDKATNGMTRGDLIIIAGRPSMGKSAMASNICESVCYTGKTAALFSLEMAKEQLIERFFASNGELNFGRIRSGYFQDRDWSKLINTGCTLHNFNLFIDDTPAVTLQDIRSKARALKRKEGLDLVVVDYLQLMGIPAKENRTLEIGKVSRGLKQLARELDTPVILLSQLNRGVDSRQEKRPTMGDLRDSGEIEQDADVILFPFRPAAYCDLCRDKINNQEHDTELHQSVAEIIIEKQRNGERNIKIPMAWFGKYQKFVSVDD